jgi:hypothetical protein
MRAVTRLTTMAAAMIRIIVLQTTDNRLAQRRSMSDGFLDVGDTNSIVMKHTTAPISKRAPIVGQFTRYMSPSNRTASVTYGKNTGTSGIKVPSNVVTAPLVDATAIAVLVW